MPNNDPNLHKCGQCGRLFARTYWLEIHNEKHTAEQLARDKQLQRKLDDQWHADHPGPLIRAWNRVLDFANGVLNALLR